MLRAQPVVFALGCAGFCAMLAHDSLPTTFVLYTNYRYGWGQKMVGLVLALVGVASILVQGGLVGRLVSWFGERRALAIGFASGAAGMLVYSFAPTGASFLCGIVMTALYGVASPSLQSLMTRLVGSHQQGQLQGAIGSMNGVANMIAPVLFTGVFAAAIGRYRELNLPGAPFLLAAIFLLAALAIGWRVTAVDEGLSRLLPRRHENTKNII
jgi:DHA1 family tetracycline resistance protein-like MFS transporter